MFYYLYEVKNNLNGKIYVGVHKTNNLNDGYMGSGKVITRAIKKNGVENFTKVILETFENSEAMYAREKEIVTDEFLCREDVYNLRRGGSGGFDYINKEKLNGFSLLTKDEMVEIIRRGRKVTAKKYGNDFFANVLRKYRLSEKYINPFSNRTVQQLGNTAEARKKASITAKKTFSKIGHAQGSKNSQFGTMWITNGNANKKIKNTGLIPEGWNKGRK